MTPSQVFSYVGMIAMPMWLLMIFLPQRKVTKFLMDYKVVPLVLVLVYAVYIIKGIVLFGMMDFGSLASFMDFFTKENTVLASWVHYLAFDLLVGMWMIDQNKNVGIHQVLMAPCLLATFLFGPLGFFCLQFYKLLKNKHYESDQ